MKLILYLIVTLFVILGKINANELNSSQKTVAIQLIQIIWGEQIEDPCNYEGKFSCTLMDLNDINSELTVTRINFYSPNVSPTTITNDLSIFKNVTSITLDRGILIKSSFFTNIYKLTQLTELLIDTHKENIIRELILPDSLKSITFYDYSANLANGFFSNEIKELLIYGASTGYTTPSSIPSSNKMTKFAIPVTYYAPLPSNLANQLPSLTDLTILVYNERDVNYQNYTLFTNNAPFSSLVKLSIQFIYDPLNGNSLQVWESPLWLKKSSNVKVEVSIVGDGLIPNSVPGIMDFSNTVQGSVFSFDNSCGLFSKCTKKPCLGLPQNSDLRLKRCPINLSLLDFSNVQYFYDQLNTLTQPLPYDTINFENIKQFKIETSSTSGAIPNEFCKLNQVETKLVLKETELTSVPSCFLCLGGNVFSETLFPNQFGSSFTSDTPPTCQFISVELPNDKTFIIKTDGSTELVINGHDIGYTILNVSPEIEDVIFEITIPNTEITVTTPIGEGSEIKTFTIQLYNEFDFQISYKYETPLITNYYFDSSSEGGKLVIQGNGFSFLNFNNLTINGIEYNGESIAKQGGIINNINSTNALNDLLIGGSFNVSINVSGVISPVTTFYLYKDVLLNQYTDNLNNTGGQITLSGDFSTATIDKVSVLINQISCNIISINKTSLVINYPIVSSAGNYPLTVNIGGYLLKSNVNYIIVTLPPLPTPSPSSNQSSDDIPNSSSIIQWSLLLFISTCISLLTI